MSLLFSCNIKIEGSLRIFPLSFLDMSKLVEREGFKIESVIPTKKKTKDKKHKSKDVGHVKIIDDDAPVPWGTTTETEVAATDEIVSVEDAPIVVGMNTAFFS